MKGLPGYGTWNQGELVTAWMLMSVLAKNPYSSGLEGKTSKMVSRKQINQAPHIPKRA